MTRFLKCPRERKKRHLIRIIWRLHGHQSLFRSKIIKSSAAETLKSSLRERERENVDFYFLIL